VSGAAGLFSRVCGGMLPSQVINRYWHESRRSLPGPCLDRDPRMHYLSVLPGDVVGVTYWDSRYRDRAGEPACPVMRTAQIEPDHAHSSSGILDLHRRGMSGALPAHRGLRVGFARVRISPPAGRIRRVGAIVAHGQHTPAISRHALRGQERSAYTRSISWQPGDAIVTNDSYLGRGHYPISTW